MAVGEQQGFKDRVAGFVEFGAGEVVTRIALLHEVRLIEETGQHELSVAGLSPAELAGGMLSVLAGAADITVRPPLAQEHKKLFTGKTALYEALRDSGSRTAEGPTDTASLQTGGKK